MLLLERFSVTSAGSVTFGEQLDRFSIPSAALRAGSVEDDDPSRLSLLRMTEEDDELVSVGAAMVGDASSEHAAKQTMSAAAANL